MIRQIAPQFFTTDMASTLAYYKDKLGFDCVGTWNDPPVYAIVARDEHRIHFRLAEPPTPNPDKHADELLDAYVFIDDADALYGNMPCAESSSREPLAIRRGIRASLSSRTVMAGCSRSGRTRTRDKADLKVRRYEDVYWRVPALLRNT